MIKNSMLITEKRLEEALKYISHTDEDSGRLDGLCKGLKRKEKIVFAQAFLNAQGGSVAEREAKARTSQEYRSFEMNYEEKEVEKDILQVKRLTEFTVIEVWRSLNSSRNKGNIT